MVTGHVHVIHVAESPGRNSRLILLSGSQLNYWSYFVDLLHKFVSQVLQSFYSIYVTEIHSLIKLVL